MIEEKVCGTCSDYIKCIEIGKITRKFEINLFNKPFCNKYKKEKSSFKIINRFYLGLVRDEIKDPYDKPVIKIIICLYIILRWIAASIGLIVYNYFNKNELK